MKYICFWCINWSSVPIFHPWQVSLKKNSDSNEIMRNILWNFIKDKELLLNNSLTHLKFMMEISGKNVSLYSIALLV